MSVEDVANRLAALWDRVDDVVSHLAELSTSQLREHANPRRADLDLEATCKALVEDREGAIDGAGFIACRGRLADAEYWIEWWQNRGTPTDRRAERLVADTDPGSVGFRDYTGLGWYRSPLATTGLTVTGPYIDYICTDQHTLTFARAIGPEERRYGLVGVDVLAAWTERKLGQVLDESPGAVVVNEIGRVIVASGAEYFAGDLLPGFANSRRWERRACGRSPLLVMHPATG